MAYIRMVTKGYDKEQVVEVFVKGKELLKVLQQQGIHSSTANPDDEYCLTFEEE